MRQCLIRALVVSVASILMLAGVARAQQINMVVTAAFVSEKGIGVYDEIANYIGRQIEADVKLISGTSYDISNLLLEQGIVQVGFICGLPYVNRVAQGDVELIAIPVMAVDSERFQDTPGYKDIPGKYYSYTIVHKDAPYQDWMDLKGKSYAYNDQDSNSGYNMPRYKLIQLGARSWEEWFSRIEVSGSHEESIRMVARGVVDASSVDSLVLDFDRHIGDPDALNVKVIEVLLPGGVGIPPVVVNASLPTSIKTSLRKAFLGMHKQPEGRAILKRALLSRFESPDDHNYDDIRRMQKIAKQVGFVDHKVK